MVLKNGQSIGKRMLKLMVVRLADNRPCTMGNSFARNLFASILQAIEIVICQVHEKGQSAGDLVLKTQVINSEQYYR